jgi:hypothetical protein
MEIFRRRRRQRLGGATSQLRALRFASMRSPPPLPCRLVRGLFAMLAGGAYQAA